MSKKDTVVCPRCLGVISRSTKRRNLTLEQSVANHEATCPSPTRRIKDGET